MHTAMAMAGASSTPSATSTPSVSLMRHHCRETLGYLMKRAYRRGTAQAGLVGLVGLVRPAHGLPAGEQGGHLGGQELEVRGVVRHPLAGGRVPADEVHALLE